MAAVGAKKTESTKGVNKNTVWSKYNCPFQTNYKYLNFFRKADKASYYIAT